MFSHGFGDEGSDVNNRELVANFFWLLDNNNFFCIEVC